MACPTNITLGAKMGARPGHGNTNVASGTVYGGRSVTTIGLRKVLHLLSLEDFAEYDVTGTGNEKHFILE